MSRKAVALIAAVLALGGAAAGLVIAAGGANAGGNAQTIKFTASDLFVEIIRLPDAKGYVQTAHEYFEEYKELYGGE